MNLILNLENLAGFLEGLKLSSINLAVPFFSQRDVNKEYFRKQVKLAEKIN